MWRTFLAALTVALLAWLVPPLPGCAAAPGTALAAVGSGTGADSDESDAPDESNDHDDDSDVDEARCGNGDPRQAQPDCMQRVDNDDGSQPLRREIVLGVFRPPRHA